MMCPLQIGGTTRQRGLGQSLAEAMGSLLDMACDQRTSADSGVVSGILTIVSHMLE